VVKETWVIRNFDGTVIYFAVYLFCFAF